jgi:hypothetical protein
MQNIVFISGNARPFITLKQQHPPSKLQPVGSMDSNIYITSSKTGKNFAYFDASWRQTWFTFDEWKKITAQEVHTTVLARDVGPGTIDTIFVNEKITTATLLLGPYRYRDLSGSDTGVSLTLPPYSSRIMQRMPEPSKHRH